MSELKLDKDTKTRLAAEIRRYIDRELEIEIGNMEAEFFLDFLAQTLGPSFCNLGLKDAQTLISRRMIDLNDDMDALARLETTVSPRK
ncbi:hypothetical protein GCM10011316_33930 [Roseibium aquae]|uniref:DUF2164 domain-containing protein n=1 Tax=Roseibium aquae TaxID=1323746 RepID=A0A916TMS5_9HYPH|nr:DUF2164 domain-containing protein [Roseibium aquae]GGB59112.1 hypothetical protein GCM10011316_33930 [Roseibium aquae]